MKNTNTEFYRPFIWFLIINSLVAMLISGRYFSYMPALPNDLLGITFIVSSVISQMSLLSFLIALVTLPFALISKRSYLISTSLISAAGILLLITDTFVFAQYRFHINAIVLELVMSAEVVDFSLFNKIFVVIAFCILLLAQYLLLSFLLRHDFFKMYISLQPGIEVVRTYCESIERNLVSKIKDTNFKGLKELPF